MAVDLLNPYLFSETTNFQVASGCRGAGLLLGGVLASPKLAMTNIRRSARKRVFGDRCACCGGCTNWQWLDDLIFVTTSGYSNS